MKAFQVGLKIYSSVSNKPFTKFEFGVLSRVERFGRNFLQKVYVARDVQWKSTECNQTKVLD